MVISEEKIRHRAAALAASLSVMPEAAAVTAYAMIMTLRNNADEAFAEYMRGTRIALEEITEKGN